MAQGKKVGFIGIGAQKSATSWLHHVLSEHPQITASEPKELNYFTANYDRGDLWYENQFTPASEDNIRGECSPTYFFSKDAPLRAQRYNPDLRLIVILRDPVSRAFSNHLHELRKGHIAQETSFEAALAANHAYVEQSQYAENLTCWLDHFDRESLLVLLAEEIAADPGTTFRAVCRHLGVSADNRPAGLGERRHESVANKSDRLQSKIRMVGEAARSLGLGKFVEQIKKAPPVRGLLALNKRDLRKTVPPMEQATRQELTRLFRKDVAYVADILGRRELPWPTWQALARDAEAVRSRGGKAANAG